MQTSDWDHLETTSKEDEQPKAPEDDVDWAWRQDFTVGAMRCAFSLGQLGDKDRKLPEV